MNSFKPNGLATAIGSMPHTDPQEACRLVLKYLPEIPAWPQLPKRSPKENMYAQFLDPFPGVVIEGERIWVDRSRDLNEQQEQLEPLYAASEGLNSDYKIDYGDYARGFRAFLGAVPLPPKPGSPQAVKGQVTGPISLGLTVTDQNRRPLLYDPVLVDALARHLRLKASWQETRLRIMCSTTIIFIDEPYMASFGSAFVSISREQVSGLLEEVFSGISGLKGIHCCGNTDWSVLLGTSLDIISFDAYNYSQSLSLYPTEITDFLNRGGVIAWGIVPSDEDALAQETVKGLVYRLEEAMTMLSKKGINFDTLWHQCLITPSCGLGSISIEAATKALELTAGVSTEFRKKYLSA